MLRVICESPSRDSLIRSLFESCFEQAPSSNNNQLLESSLSTSSADHPDSGKVLHPQRYSTLRLLALALPCIGPLGVELFQRYQRTSSTVLLPVFLTAMVASPLFSDADLEVLLLGSVDKSRQAVLDACREHPHRRNFIGKMVLDKKLAPLSLLSHANPEQVEQFLASSGSAADVAAFVALGFSNWNALSSVYLSHIRRQLMSVANDPIKKGVIYRSLESRCQLVRASDVMELFTICEQLGPLEIDASVPAGVRAHLQELSHQGALVGRQYQGVLPVFPCDRLLVRLGTEDKLALLKNSVVRDSRGGLAFTESRLKMCQTLLTSGPARNPSRKAILGFVKEVLEAMPEEILWEIYTGTTNNTADNKALKDTFQSLKGFLNLARWSENKLALTGVDIWLAMHRRSTPTAAVVARYAGQKTEADLWTAWTQSAFVLLLEHTKAVSQKASLSLDRCSVHSSRSTITSYVGYLRILLEDLQSILVAAGPHLDAVVYFSFLTQLADATNAVFARAEQTSLGVAAKNSTGSAVVQNVRKIVQSMVSAAIERLSTSLVFDPASYVMESRHPQIAPLLGRLSTAPVLSYLPGLRSVVFAFCEGVFERVKIGPEATRLGFVEVVQQSVRSFVHFNVGLHKSWSVTASQLLGVLCTSFGDNNELVTRVWARVKQEKYESGTPKDKAGFNKYVEECRAMPLSVLTAEKPNLIAAAAKLLQVDQLDAPVAELFARLGWLMETLDACDGGGGSINMNDADEAVLPSIRQKMLLRYGDVSIPVVRELMQASTSNREPTVRIQAHVALMNRSRLSVPQMATTLSFVAQRTRNEAGLYRPALYQWLSEQMREIVSLSLVDAAKTEASALENIDSMCSALERMLRDDTAKRDTVAKNAFRTIASILFSTAITWNPAERVYEARRRWIACGATLECIVIKAISGEQGVESFVWPVQNITLSKECSVPEEWLQDYRAFLTSTFRAGVGRFNDLSIRVYTQRLFREQGANQRWDVSDVIQCLLGAAQTEDLTPASTTKVFPQPTTAGMANSMMLTRVKLLFALAGTRWVEVDALVQLLESFVAAVEDKTIQLAPLVSHLRQLQSLFDAIRAIYPRGSLWYEIPLLARVCESLFDASIRIPVADMARSLLPVWTELKTGRDRVKFSPLKPTQVAWIITQVPTLGTDELVNKPDFSLEERRASLALALLAKTPSAAYVVSADLLKIRDDLALTYLHKTRGELKGVFDPNPLAATVAQQEIDARSLAPIFVDPVLWAKFNGQTIRVYTKDALDEALNTNLSPHVRSSGMSRYVLSPALNYIEIIDVLSKLLAIKNKKGNNNPSDQDDPALDLLLETIILSVFQTDAAWPVLTYLLSPEVMAASAVRTTASILTNLHMWIPMDKVVGVLRTVLEPQRRWAVQVFLHKSILRMLFEAAAHEDARKLFLQEWSMRKETQMHRDVCHEMVKLAVSALHNVSDSTEPSSKLEMSWRIMEDVASSQPGDFGETTVMLLFLPTLQPAFTFSTQRPIDSLLRVTLPVKSDAPESFARVHEKWLAESVFPFSSGAVRDRMLRALRTIASTSGAEHPYLRSMALCKEFTFSPCITGAVDDESLNRLQQVLLSNSVYWKPSSSSSSSTTGSQPWDLLTSDKTFVFALAPEDFFLIHVLSRLFAALSLQILAKEFETSFTPHERASGDVAREKLCKRHPTAERLRGVFALVLEGLARSPPMDVEKRTRLAGVLHGLVGQANETGFSKVLFMDHFQSAISFLRSDIERLKPVF